ncbi:hypothetical protein PF007_g29588 [Phytophthora fragariae]|uniref:Uncharacterized protein n=3 Tax=Phytophthora fragariae TaxID=53985 RepID=A0A6A3PLZ0_9STRA|nr:hypothetical protein PF003_g6916 [Phytophthora fragariae]KAE9063328.1 hypothetical protein PF007_g29588 [Phytophthora fragariae]
MRSPSCAPRVGSPSQQPQQQHATVAHDHLDGAGATPSSALVSVDLAMAKEPTPEEEDSSSNNNGSDCSASGSPTAKPKKSVRWATITVHEFGVGLSGSAVSNKGGPPIGLADTPEFTWTTRVGEMAECVEGVHRFSPNQRIRLLQAAGIPDGIITRHAREANIILGSRRRSKMSWDESELDEADEEEEEECQEPLRKRSADQAGMLCAVYLRRPRMIPVNYV